MTEPLPQVNASDISIDENGRIVISNPELAKVVGKALAAQEPVAPFINIISCAPKALAGQEAVVPFLNIISCSEPR
jgi:hypothetical protein